MFNFKYDFDEKFSLKYSRDEIPKDYDISELFYTFDFIYLVYKKDASIDKAIDGVAFEYGLSDSYLRGYLIRNNYILNRKNKNEELKQLSKYNTKALKKILKKNGLKTSGKRERIEERIIENNLIGGDYYLSSKSKVFYKNKKRRFRIFNKYLFDYYYFDEFNEYYMDNYRKREYKIPTEYVDLHIRKAVEDKDHHNYVLNSEIMAEIYYEDNHPRKMMEYVLKVYCANLNPVWKLDQLNEHGGLTVETYDLLQYLRETLGKNRIISAYFAIWDSFNFESIIVSKYTGYRYLKQILNGKSYNAILNDLDEKFYSNDDLKVKRIVQKTLFDF